MRVLFFSISILSSMNAMEYKNNECFNKMALTHKRIDRGHISAEAESNDNDPINWKNEIEYLSGDESDGGYLSGSESELGSMDKKRVRVFNVLRAHKKK